MSKPEILTRVKGFFAALLVLTLGVLIIIPLTSTLVRNGQESIMNNMTIYIVLLLAWIVLAIAFGIAYLASEGSKGLKPITLPVQKEQEG